MLTCHVQSFACMNACLVLQDSLNSEANSLQDAHAELDQRFADLQQQHQSDVAAAAARQATLQSELQGLTEVHVSVLNQLSEATAEVNELGDLAQEHSQLTADLANLRAAHERLQASKQEADAEHAELQTRAETLTQSLADSKSAHAELSFTLTTLRAGLDSTSQHLADSEAANAELSCKLSTLQSEAETSLAHLKDQLADMSRQHSDAQQSCQQLHNQLLQAKTDCDSLADARQVSSLHFLKLEHVNDCWKHAGVNTLHLPRKLCCNAAFFRAVGHSAPALSPYSAQKCFAAEKWGIL